MEVVNVLWGFFLLKKIKDAEKFFDDLNQEVRLNLNKDFSMPRVVIKDFPKDSDLPLLNASKKDIKLTIFRNKILIQFEGEGRKNLKNFVKIKEETAKKIIKFIQKSNDIKRIGIVIKVFVELKNPLKYLQEYLNSDYSKDKKIKELKLKLNYLGKIDDIKTNNILDVERAIKIKKKKKIKGILLGLDINNVKENKLEKEEVLTFLKKLGENMIKKINGEIK